MVMLCTCVLAYAQPLNVQEISLPPIANTFYFYSPSPGSSNWRIPTTSFYGGKMRLGEGAWDYTINGSVTTTSSALDRDTSESGRASGLFKGGGTITITGKIKYQGAVIYDGTILKANMIIDVNHTWGLCENGSDDISGSIDFLPDTSIGLGYGILPVGWDDSLKIGNFRCDFSFNGISPTPTDFSTGNFAGTTNTVQMMAIPEPVTMLLLALGSAAILSRKH